MPHATLSRHRSPLVVELVSSLDSLIGFKMCGAGGGGCFLLVHERGVGPSLTSHIKNAGMTVLNYQIAPPLSELTA